MLSYILIGVLCLGLPFVFILVGQWLGRPPLWHKKVWDRAQLIMKDEPAVKTPENHEVYYEPQVSTVDLSAVDEGFNDTMARLVCQGYPVNKSQHNLKVVVLASELSPEMQAPCFRVPIMGFDPFFNSEWDMMKDSHKDIHYILAAGMTVAVGQPYGDVICIPQSNDRNAVKLGVDHETEHFGLDWYDGARADANRYHQNGPHPFIPPCPGSPSGLMKVIHPSGEHEGKCILLVK